MTIRVLLPEVASQIAAGEVVERPASVVKELLENSLDANAKTVSVNIMAAGRSRIEVADDGQGIPEAELHLAVERHATSKLVSSDDLFRIATLGFRGEALASIGSVSCLTITSRIKESSSGACLRVEGGVIGRFEKVGAPIGTMVSVERLFYNVPARLKFLKKDITERRAIDALLTRYSLAYPTVRFKVNEENSPSFQTSGDGDRRAILAALYGIDTARQMLEVKSEEEGLRLSGFISPINLTRSNRKEITFFINGRWVKDPPLSTAIMQAYHTLLMVGRYPLTMLFLEIAPEEVDVNVHPAKAEVRFRNPDKIFSFVQRTTRRALLAYSPVPSIPLQNFWGKPVDLSGRPDPTWALAHEEITNETLGVLGKENSLDASSPVKSFFQPADNVAQRQETNMAVPLLRLIGQIGATYLVAEGPDGLYLIDQHAAHERILFEKLMAQHGLKGIPPQALLTPEVVQVTPAAAKLLEEQLPILQKFGFQVEPFGQNSFRVYGMPSLFKNSNPALALRVLIEDFEEDETPFQNEIEAKIAGRVCKRMAVKAGQILTVEEQRGLLMDLENCASPRTCPHGRPTMIHLSVDMLERQFGRKGAR